jgi:hypothetical protein
MPRSRDIANLAAPWRAMPRFFFHIRHEELSAHEEGLNLPDVLSAWREANTASGEMLRDLPLKAGQEWRMEVEGEDGRVLFAIRVFGKYYDV